MFAESSWENPTIWPAPVIRGNDGRRLAEDIGSEFSGRGSYGLQIIAADVDQTVVPVKDINGSIVITIPLADKFMSLPGNHNYLMTPLMLCFFFAFRPRVSLIESHVKPS